MKTWVLTKILAYLQAQEGFTMETDSKEDFIVADAFGFRYQIQVKLLGRNYVGLYAKEIANNDLLKGGTYGTQDC